MSKETKRVLDEIEKGMRGLNPKIYDYDVDWWKKLKKRLMGRR